MAPRRRPRGSLIDPAQLGYAIERVSKDRLDKIAAKAGVSSAVMLEHIIDNVALTGRGLPVTWPETTELIDGELPIDTA